MKIGIYGYGKMGRSIEAAAKSRGHQVPLTVGSSEQGKPPIGIDVAIEFSTPTTAIDNIRLMVAHGVPCIVGTTGWYDKLNQVADLVREEQGAILYASNFSIGVNLFFLMNKMLAGLMNEHPQYNAALTETHHIHKLDAPSGTALTLARDAILQHKRYTGYAMKSPQEHELPIAAIREGEVPGTHTMAWKSDEDEITLCHQAYGREGFAKGAVVAAEWLNGHTENGKKRTGLFTFDDVLNNR